MKNIILIIILIGIVAISNAVRMKVKSHEVIMNSQNDIASDYQQISITFLNATNDLFPVQSSQGAQINVSTNLHAE